ncbi:MAG: HD domain-containing protein [Candidatus Diapherotrites archaeon]
MKSQSNYNSLLKELLRNYNYYYKRKFSLVSRALDLPKSLSIKKISSKSLASALGLPKNIPIIFSAKKESPEKFIERAFWFSACAHKSQERASGEPYFIHPYNTALNLSKWGLDEKIIAAGLLHDVLEDTDVELNELKRIFGEHVSSLVESLTKLNVLVEGSPKERRIAALQKLLFSSTKDMGVVIIKLADKLHNIRTINFLPEERKKRIALDAIEVYAPLAHKLGINAIEKEIEEQCFSVIKPKIYLKLKEKIKSESQKKISEIELMKKELKKEFKSFGLKASFAEEFRSPSSIFIKMNRSGKSLDEIHDFVLLIILTNTIPDCYKALGALHELFPPIPLKFKDFIAIPESEWNQALHTTVIGPNGKPVKVYIMTKQMRELAEFGILYWLKEHKNLSELQKISLIESLSSLSLDSLSSSQFMESLKEDLLQNQIFVFSGEGKLVELPFDSTPLDFAFCSGSESALNSCKAIVNGRRVPLWHKLNSGDIVEVIASDKIQAKPAWLSFTKSNEARTAILSAVKGKKYSRGKEKSLLHLKVSALDRTGLLNDFCHAFFSSKANIVSADIQTNKKKGLAEDSFTLEVESRSQLNSLLKKLNKIKGITEIKKDFIQ